MKTNKSELATTAFALKIFGAFLLCTAFLLPATNALAQSEKAPAQAAEMENAEVSTIDSVEGHTIVSNTGEKFTAEEVFTAKGINLEGAEKFVQPGFEGSGVADLIKQLPKEDGFDIPLGEGYEDSRSVIGADERWRITNTTSWPYRAIVKLRIQFPGSSSWSGCTGWMIDANTVATAGHCLYSRSRGQWASRVYVYPGRNGYSSPYGYAYATNLYSVNGWVNSGSQNYDYGAMKLNRNIGNSTGWFGFRWQSSNSFPGGYSVTGYPGDLDSGTWYPMYRGYKNPGIRRVWSMRLFYEIDTFGGQSGSPVYRWTSDCSNCAYAIHTNGVGGDPYGRYNSGTRITQSVFNNLIAWRNR